MMHLLNGRAALALTMALATAGCGSAMRAGGGAAAGPAVSAPPAGSLVSDADVHFMTGMIPHHAQAVKIARWAASHDAGAELRRLCERIVVGQQDEIELMRNWLLDRSRPAPAADATHMRMKVGEMEHDMLMPGMLSDEELAQLDRARGAEFDRLFLTFMIRHHEGAVAMVDQLFSANGAGQDETVFRLASDIYADQTTEIDRMQKMLAALGGSRP